MKWVPPIPGGKLTSKPVRDLGSAVVFLHWCYEAVRRDGTIEFQVNEVADYLEESYYTVRKWWAAVKDGPWFAEVTDRGKRGFRVRMADDWIEWRVFKSPSTQNEVPDLVLEDDEMLVNAPSTQNEMHNPVLEPSAYKVLHDSQESSPSAVSKNGKHTPDRQMVMMLMEKGIKSSSVANEIAMMGLDVLTVAQSIDNLIADKTSIAAIVGFLRTNPPEKDKPYPRAPSRASPPMVNRPPLIPPDMLTPTQLAERAKTRRAERDTS